jgi:hypothetical protein
MIMNIRFAGLEGTKLKMQAPDVEWQSSLGDMDSPDFLVELSGTGIEIELHEVEGNDEGLLVYKGQHVLLYIKDTRQDRQTLLYDPESSRRFHIADKCQTLEDMRADNRYDRYVVTNRKDGLFLVDAETGLRGRTEELEAPLQVCKNCLKALEYENYDRHASLKKWQIWRSFSIEDFFMKHATHFIKKPKYTDKTFPSGGYSSDWGAISSRTREAANWICEECGIDLQDHKNLLHVHHKNGVKSDNSPGNLEVLCAVCHGEEPAHGRMHIPRDGNQIIQRLRAKNVQNGTLKGAKI